MSRDEAEALAPGTVLQVVNGYETFARARKSYGGEPPVHDGDEVLADQLIVFNDEPLIRCVGKDNATVIAFLPLRFVQTKE